MFHKLFHWMAAIAAFAASASFAHAQTKNADGWTDYPNVSIRLFPGPNLKGGSRGLLIQLRLASGWKTYWRMPGDAGIPPTFDWQGSENLAAAEVQYPVPQALADQGGTAIGYKGEVTFPVNIRPQNLADATSLKLQFDLGVCKDVCIPVEAKLAVVLRPGGVADDNIWSKAMAQVPVIRDANSAKVGSPALLGVKGEIGSYLTFDTKGATAVYVEAPDGLFVPLAQRTAEDKFVIDLTKAADAKDLVGKPLRLTIAGPNSAIETTWIWPKS